MKKDIKKENVSKRVKRQIANRDAVLERMDIQCLDLLKLIDQVDSIDSEFVDLHLEFSGYLFAIYDKDMTFFLFEKFPRLYDDQSGMPSYEEFSYEIEKALAVIIDRMEMDPPEDILGGKKYQLDPEVFFNSDTFLFSIIAYELMRYFLASGLIFKGMKETDLGLIPISFLGGDLVRGKGINNLFGMDPYEGFYTHQAAAVESLEFLTKLGFNEKLRDSVYSELMRIESSFIDSESIPQEQIINEFVINTTLLISWCIGITQEEGFYIASSIGKHYGFQKQSYASFKTLTSRMRKSINIEKEITERYLPIISKLSADESTETSKRLHSCLEKKLHSKAA